MKKIYSIFTIVLSALTFFSCEGTNILKVSFNTDKATLKNRINEILVADNYRLDINDSQTLSTEWRKATIEENNIPDNTIEVKLEVTIYSVSGGSEILLKVMKRSSLNSTDPNTPTYSDIGIIMNDMLYKKWNAKLKLLQGEFKK